VSAFAIADAQQPQVSLSPFVTFLPTESARPMAGLSLMFTGGPLALRAGGHLSLKDRGITTATGTETSVATLRPWGADADALAFLESYSYGERIAFTPYAFVGVSTSAVDSGVRRINQQGWSYGGGLTIPLGSALGLLGEARWRMSRFVMPNAPDAPQPTREFRFGFSFRVGSGSSSGGVPVEDLVRVIQSSDGSLVVDPSSGNGAASSRKVDHRDRLISTADGYVGTPYRRGGTNPASGFDASGFVRFVFSRMGVNLPRLSRDQARVGEKVRPDWRSIAPGDLVMFEDDGGINHVAIYVGRSRIIHSSASGGGVRYDDLESERGRWFVEHLVAARRITPDLRGMLLDLARGFSNDLGKADGPDHAPKAEMRRRR
jgi:hypothetical protein